MFLPISGWHNTVISQAAGPENASIKLIGINLLYSNIKEITTAYQTGRGLRRVNAGYRTIGASRLYRTKNLRSAAIAENPAI